MDCRHEATVQTGCLFQRYCYECMNFLLDTSKGDPCRKKLCDNLKCHSYGKVAETDRVIQIKEAT